jgi:hypothetical protein
MQEGMLWARINQQASYAGWQNEKPPVAGITRINPRTLLIEEVIPLDGPDFAMPLRGPRRFTPARSFEVLDGSIFVVGAEKLMKRPRGSKIWTTFPLPERGDLWVVDGKLYLSCAEGIYEVNPADGSARVLASVRRRPGQCVLDELQSLGNAPILPAPNGIRTVVGRASYFYDGAAWKAEATFPNMDVEAVLPNVFFCNRHMYDAGQLQLLRFDSRTPSVVVETPKPSSESAQEPRPATNWVFSRASLDLSLPFILGTNTALLVPRWMPYSMPEHTAKSVTVDLFVFGRADKKPVQVPLTFDLSKGNFPPTMPTEWFQRWVLFTDEYLLLAHSARPGFWKIRLADIEERIVEALQTNKNSEEKLTAQR